MAECTLHCCARSGSACRPALPAGFRRRAEAAWAVLNADLAGCAFVAAPRLTVADPSLCGYLFWPEEIGVDWRAYPRIAGWLQRIRALPRRRHPYRLMPGRSRPPQT